MKRFSKFLALCALLVPGIAAAQNPRLAEIMDARMRPGWQTDTGTHMAGLHIRLAGNWITYWRHPGESGIVPRLDWSGSRNVAAARIHWPEPRLFTKSGVASIGYGDEIILPIELTPTDAGLPMELDATLSLGVCDDICIPVELALQLGLNNSGMPDGMIATALTQRPRAARTAGLQAVSCTITPERKGLRLSASMTVPPQGAEEFALVELQGSPIRNRALPSERAGDTITGHAYLRPAPGEAIDRSAVRISIVSENGVVQHQGCTFPD
ncbi:MAG: hypothetical protein LAT78_04495 [Roseinatronobacter sp.]|jgi:DsbC/DsbD-like thiol-disulfide interchange protein|nr:hypothetical protein [Roseinatronobacter sp.]